MVPISVISRIKARNTKILCLEFNCISTGIFALIGKTLSRARSGRRHPRSRAEGRFLFPLARSTGSLARNLSSQTLAIDLGSGKGILPPHGLPVVTAPVVSSYFTGAAYSMTTTETLRAYRYLYRAALRAVRHSSPAKYQIRDTMRSAFRNGSVETLNRQKVENTLQFLRRAESHAGMEHKILQNLLHVRYWQNQGRRDNRLLVTSSKPY
jgi:hypothetical protein